MRKKGFITLIFAVVFISLGLFFLYSPMTSTKKVPPAQKQIAVVYVEGVIMGGRGQAGILGDVYGTDHIIRQLHMARDDESVGAIVLRVNSPGGSVPATQELAEEIIKVRNMGKPIITSMGDSAASGGYWIAAVTDKIYANPSTLTGSIGVYVPYTNLEELYKKIGIRQEKIKSGVHKDIMSPERELSASERVILQGMVDEMYLQFITVVAEGRKLDINEVRKIADGRVYTGLQAQKLGLVDELGNFYDAIDAAAEMSGIMGKPIIKEYGKTNPWSMFFSSNNIKFEELMMKKITNELPIIAPMAMPSEW